ncbi:unnamed protein product [Porites evermanni]|uniref:RGS domain-containing protein n=1 Tax=Porites evermanni TaxID=104178 RepID=A0ABN8LX10_9CNID|nr:unnamed protein product [Porites evermanni]
MLRFSRKPSTKEKQGKGKSSKSGKSKGKSKKQLASAPPNDAIDRQNNLIGIQECRKLLSSVSGKKSAKCVATFPRKSQLSKSLTEVLMDDSVLPYFMEYMQKQNAMNLLNFWLTAETFRLSTINRLRINSVSRLKTSKAELSTNTDIDRNIASAFNSDTSHTGSSVNEQSKDNSLKESRNQQQSIESDNKDFGDFTSYEPESSTSTGNTTGNNGDVLLLCDKCGRLIESSKTFLLHLNTNCSQASTESVEDSGTLKSSRSSKVTFDLKPDYEHERREFCRRRTRSIVIDAVSIYSKYISLEASHPIGLEESMRRQIEINICSEDGRICPDSFQPAQKFAFDVMQKMYFPTFLGSSHYCKHQIDILTSGKVFLSDILYNQNAMFYFMEHLEQEGVQHMLEFWLTADNFQYHLKAQLENNEYNAQHALEDAMIIYDKYISMQASVPLGVDDITRIEIENKICREGGPLPDCFSCLMEHVLCLLEEVFFPSFLQGEVHFKYLTELLNSVSERRNSQTLSASVGSVDDVQNLEENNRLVRSSFGSDLDLTEHPDAIWQRPNAGPLSLGKVNEFGIFEPIFEPEPDRGNGISTAAKLGKAMRKLVSGVEDKAKEEMAWKIAKMIIEDVKNEQAKPL